MFHELVDDFEDDVFEVELLEGFVEGDYFEDLLQEGGFGAGKGGLGEHLPQQLQPTIHIRRSLDLPLLILLNIPRHPLQHLLHQPHHRLLPHLLQVIDQQLIDHLPHLSDLCLLH